MDATPSGKYLSIRISPNLRKRLARLAKTRHQNISEFVRMAIEEKVMRAKAEEKRIGEPAA